MMAAEPDRLFPSEAARILRVTPQTVRRLIARGVLKAHRVGAAGYRLLDRREVERLDLRELALARKFGPRRTTTGGIDGEQG